MAATNFLKNDCDFDDVQNVVALSKIFFWYKNDFIEAFKSSLEIEIDEKLSNDFLLQ